MSTSAHKNDSSMDDILASIRSIISDDVRQSVGAPKTQVNPASKRVEKEAPSKVPGNDLSKGDLSMADASEADLPEGTAVDGNTPSFQDAVRDDDVSFRITHAIDAPQRSSQRASEDSITDRIRSRIRAEASQENASEPRRTAPVIDDYTAASPVPSVVRDAMHPLGFEPGNADNATREDGASDADRDDAQDDTEDDAIFIDWISDEAVARSLEALSPLDKVTDAEKLKTPQTPTPQSSGKTLEDIMREALRPMLREWLDRNLPSVVHDVVSEQVEKILALRAK